MSGCIGGFETTSANSQGKDDFQHTVYIDYSDYRFGQASVRFGMCPGQHAPHQAARTASAEIIMMPITANLVHVSLGASLACSTREIPDALGTGQGWRSRR